MLREVTELKKRIALLSKRNFQLESDIAALDKKIALLIKNRITLEEVLAAKGAMMETKEKTVDLKDRRESEAYGRMFWLMQHNTIYISRLARIIKLADIDNFLQTVMYSLFGNQYEEDEEHLLLTMFRTVLQADFAEAKGLSELLRANTPLSRMMTTYTRRGPGQHYLKVTLAPLLQEIVADTQLNLEINPVKVLDQYINDCESKQGKTYEGDRKPTPEVAAALPYIREIVAPRVVRLEQLAGRMVEALERTLD
jgi:Ras GTPase-activating-like protein IQGAP2/3